MELVRLVRGGDNRSVLEHLAKEQEQNKMEVELQRMLRESGGIESE